VPSQERQEPGLLSTASAGLLATAELEVVGRLAHSSNGTFLVRGAFEAETGRGELLAVYKPAAGERPLWDFPPDSLYRREVAAYELSRRLGWDLVPATIVREDGPLGPGSLQAFVEHDPEEHYFTLLERHRATFRRLAFFDLLANNADRKSGHCLLAADGTVQAIDHGLTFHAEPKLRTVIWDFAGERLPAAERRAAADLAGDLAEPGSELCRALGPLLRQDELEALTERAETLSRQGRFPQPRGNWSFPWPLV
jgi:Phosphatidylinositol 3- and 4-kinase